MPVLSLHAVVHHPNPHGGQVPRHSHQQHELVLVLRGRLRVNSAGLMLLGAPGTVHVFPAATLHDQGSSGPWHTICLLLSGDDPLLANGPLAIASGGDSLLRGWFHGLSELSRSPAPEDALAANDLLSAVLHRLRGLHRGSAEQAARPRRLREALARIDGQLDRDLDVAGLAAAVGLSVSHLGELFRRHLGCSAKRHHTRLRLDRARSLLANPYTTVSAVAHELGFADLNWFVRRFRSEHGVPPGRWRNSGLSPAAPGGRRVR